MDYPRVTEILKAYTSYEKIPEKILEGAAARGTTTHAYCAAIAKGVWLPDSMIQENCQGYVQSFRLWMDKNVDTFEIIEKRYYCDTYQFSGQIDMVATLKNGNRCLVDLKTTYRPIKTHPVQMGAYGYLLERNEEKIDVAMLVYLNKEGEYPAEELYYDLYPHQYIFFCALKCYKYFNNKEVKNGKSTEHIPKSDSSDGGAELHSEGEPHR